MMGQKTIGNFNFGQKTSIFGKDQSQGPQHNFFGQSINNQAPKESSFTSFQMNNSQPQTQP